MKLIELYTWIEDLSKNIEKGGFLSEFVKMYFFRRLMFGNLVQQFQLE